MLFAEWYQICELPGAKDAASAHFVLQLLQSGLLKGDDMLDKFFRLLMVLLLYYYSFSWFLIRLLLLHFYL